MKKTAALRWSAIGLHLVNIVLVAISIVSFFVGTGDGNMTVAGTDCFRYFTIDSNILSAVTSAVAVLFLLRKKAAPWAAVCQYVGTVAVTVTFLTVVFFLGPTQGYPKMFDGVCLYLHLICPLLSIVSLYLPTDGKPLPKRAWLFGVLPVAVYGGLYIVMVLLTRRWEDFYGFNRGGFWYVSLAAMLLFSGLLSFGMALLQRKTARCK